jgi:hypothetical protein
MHRFPDLAVTLRSKSAPLLLSIALSGCGNAPADAKSQAPQQPVVETPAAWKPKPIQAQRPIAIVDSAGARDTTSSDSTRADSLKSDSVKADSAQRDSTTGRDSLKLKRSKKPVAKVVRSPFPLTPADSARWPVPTPDPLPGSIIPEHRIVAYYGNPLSKRMGILGELEPDTMLQHLERTATEWAEADPDRKVLPALHLIATVAQGKPGPAKKYRLQMSDSVINRVASWAEERGWLLFLDVQVGLSTVEQELAPLVPYLARPYIHLALDPEFAMKDGKLPGRDWMGHMDATEVNHAVDVLAKIVDENKLPPKVLVIHRFTRNMLTNASQIKLDPRVQVVIDMDGYGPPSGKKAAYRLWVVRHPVQYTGFKLFFKNDHPMMTPKQVLELYPRPMYVQYQ